MPSSAPLRYRPASSAQSAQPASLWTSPGQYGGSFANRRSRFEVRRLRRYGGFDYQLPLVVLWIDNGWDWDDIWAAPVVEW